MNANVGPALGVETCAWCERPVRSGDPVAQTATVDIIDGRVAASPGQVLPHGGRLLPRRQATGASSHGRPQGGRQRRLDGPARRGLRHGAVSSHREDRQGPATCRPEQHKATHIR